MTDEKRQPPQYGEYATPEEVAQLRGAQTPPPDPVATQPETPRPVRPVRPATPPPASSRRRVWDLPLTVGLLAVGFVLTFQSIAGFLDFSSTVRRSVSQAGLDLEFGPEADAVGVVLLLVHCALLLAALGISVARLRAGRLAFWVPLTAGVLAFVTDAVTLFVLMIANPGYTSLPLLQP